MTSEYCLLIIDIFKALLTPIIAFIAAQIAWQQMKINQRKLELDLFDRRMKIYEEIIIFLNSITQNDRIIMSDLIKFQNATSHADFLFQPEISEYIKEICDHSFEFQRWVKKDSQPQINAADQDEIINGKQKEFDWLIEQYEHAKIKFFPYFKFKNIFH